MNEVFKQANLTKKRYRILKGSAGSGKSVNVARDFIIKLMDERYKGANLLVVRKVEESNKNSTFAELVKAINDICGENASKIWEYKVTPLEIKCLTINNTIIFRGLNDERQREKVKSITFNKGKLTCIWVEEATEIGSKDLEILDDRLRGKLNNPNLYYQITLTFNPVSSTHWIKKRFFENENSEYFIHHSTYKDNKFIDKAYIKRMELRKETDPSGYRVYALGDWGESEGMILKNYQVIAFDRNINNFDFKVYAQDFGYNHPNVILDVAFKDENIYVLEELVCFEKDTVEIINLANEKGFIKNQIMYCDSAEPDRIKMWQKEGYLARGVKKEKGSVLSQIDYLKQRKIFIHPSCTRLIEEISTWKWERDVRSDEYLDVTINYFDDAIAALRYSIEGRKNKRNDIVKVRM